MIPRRGRLAAVLVVGALGLEPLTDVAARAQVPTQLAGGAQGTSINLGGRGWSPAEAARSAPSRPLATDLFEISARAGFASDYIYRGTTLSDRKPAVGAAIEATFGQFYAGAAAASVKLPTQPAAEITVAGGVRPTLGNIDFNLGVTYFAYPGEAIPGATGINYWEAGVRAETALSQQIRVAAGFAYSPNVSNTGACNWDYRLVSAGTRTYWTPVRDLTIGLELIWTNHHVAMGDSVVYNQPVISSFKPNAAYVVRDQNIFSGMFSVRRFF